MKNKINYKGARIVVSVVREGATLMKLLDSPEAAYEYWQATVAAEPDYEPDKESVVVVCLNARMEPIAWNRVSLGTCAECSAHPREVMRAVIVSGAHAFVMMHNHPSGDPSPSKADEIVTRRIDQAAELLQIRFADHVIVGDRRGTRYQPYFSFREAGSIA